MATTEQRLSHLEQTVLATLPVLVDGIKRLDSQQTRVAEILGVVVARLNDVDEKVTQHTVQLSGIQEALGRIEERLSGL